MKLLGHKNKLASLVALTVMVTTPGVGVKAVEGEATASPTPVFVMPSAVPVGTAIRVGFSPSMALINESMQKQFSSKFADAKVVGAAKTTVEALEALRKGDLDLAAIGRPLSDAEKAEGLVEVPLSREKIAIFVGADNPFQNDLTFEQFAKLFRGEIKDWSEIGGAAGAVKFVDRPDSSDTRISLGNYDVFKSAPFTVGSTGKAVSADETASVIKELGKDGIGYGIASQVMGQQGVKVLSMHKTQPDNPKYPYSQPRGYVYKPGADGNPTPAVAAYLGYATSPEGASVVTAAKKAETDAVAKGESVASPAPSPVASPAATPAANAAPESSTTMAAPTATPDWYNWWPLGLLGVGALGWLATKLIKGGSYPVGTWGSREVTDRAAATPPKSATPTAKPTTVKPTTVKPTTVKPTPGVSSSVSPTGGVGGQITDATTAKTPTGVTGLGAAGAAAGIGALGTAAVAAVPKSWITLTPLGGEAEARWEIIPADRAKISGQPEPQLRVYDATDINLDTQPAHNVQYYNCRLDSTQAMVTLPDSDRDYVAEVGYITGAGRWEKMARSQPVRRN
jgi:phosphate transport system substrate-binding protein